MIQWEERFDIGVKKIDAQHRKIVSILNRIYSLKPGAGEKAVGKIFSELQTYIQQHFSLEEALMTQAGYPDLPAHKDQHDRFIDKIFDYQKEYAKHRSFISINVFNFVWDWFARHILVIDQQFGAFLREKTEKR